MSCYHPMIAYPTNIVDGKQQYKIKKAENNSIEAVKKDGAIIIPCGKCIGCRLDYSRKWADRMMLEYDNTKKAVFLTLTYSDNNLIDNKYRHYSLIVDSNTEDGVKYATLDKRDFQLFMKRLRKDEYFNRFKLRFFLAGEYGTKTLRPHAHIILFGVDINDIPDCYPSIGVEFEGVKKSKYKYKYYHSDYLDKIWSNGYVTIAEVNWQTCAYVARYSTKKLENRIGYDERNVIPEFSLMSRKPGIGGLYLKEHPNCLDLINIPIPYKEDIKKIAIPRYFIDQLGKEDFKDISKLLVLPDYQKYAKILDDRRKFASDQMLLSLGEQDLGLCDYLANKEKEVREKGLNKLHKYRNKADGEVINV